MRSTNQTAALPTEDAPLPPLWDALDEVVARAPGVVDLRAHGLHLVAAARLRRLGRPLPPELADDQQKAALRSLAVPVLLERIRAACEGPILLLKGYEVALHYPAPTLRPFADIDVLVPDPERAFRALTAAGFRPLGPSEDYYDGLHHLRPLCLPSLPVVVEVHRRPVWVRWSAAPSVEELVEHAVPSLSGVDGIQTLAPAQHALVVAAHSWAGAPLRRIGDVVDSAALAAGVEPGAIDAWARRWDVDGLWRYLERVADTLFAGAPPPASVRTWGRSALQVREATVFEQHERRLLGAFAVLPLRRALWQAAVELASDVMPVRGETWGMKLRRTALALRNAFVGRSRHEAALKKRRGPGS